MLLVRQKYLKIFLKMNKNSNYSIKTRAKTFYFASFFFNKKIKDEIGDLIFSVINFSRFIGIDPEESLEKTNLKFIKRFNTMEKKILKEGKSFSDMSLSEMDRYWELSKKDE